MSWKPKINLNDDSDSEDYKPESIFPRPIKKINDPDDSDYDDTIIVDEESVD